MNIVKKEDFSDFDADVDKKTDTFFLICGTLFDAKE